MQSDRRSKEYREWPSILTRRGWRRALGPLTSLTTRKTGIGEKIENTHNWHHGVDWDIFDRLYRQKDEDGLQSFFNSDIKKGISLLYSLKFITSSLSGNFDHLHPSATLVMVSKQVSDAATKTLKLLEYMPGNTRHHQEWKKEWETSLALAEKSDLPAGSRGTDPQRKPIG